MKIDELISRIEKKPGLFFTDEDISVIESMIYGYHQAVINHKLENDTSTFNHDFNEFIYQKLKWSTARGWANALINNVPKGNRFNTFLKFYKEFQLKNA